MFGVSRLVVVRIDCEVEFVLAQVIGLRTVLEPGEFQLVRRLPTVREVDKREIRLRPLMCDLEAQCLLLELPAVLQVQHVEVVMCKTKPHNCTSTHICKLLRLLFILTPQLPFVKAAKD